MIRILSVIIICSIILYCSDGIKADSREFHAVSSSNELSSMKINKIIEDRSGMLWISTPMGLNYYDGYAFRLFPNEDLCYDTYIADHGISNIQEDDKGNLWLRINKKSVYFDVNKEKLTELPIEIPNNIDKRFTNKLFHIDSSGRLWLVGEKGLLCYSPDYQLLKHHEISLSGDLDNVRIGDGDNKLYISDSSGNIHIVDETGIHQLHIPESLKSDDQCNEILLAGNQLWIAGRNAKSINVYDVNTKEWTLVDLPSNLSKSNSIRVLATDKEKNIWIATDHEGIFVYNPFQRNFTEHYQPEHYSKQNGIPSNNVSAILFDNHNNLWVGFDKHGLRVSPYTSRGIYESFKPELGDISSILTDRNNITWIGTDGHGLFATGPETTALTKLPIPDISIMALIEDQSGRIIVGTYNHGIYIIDENKNIRHLSVSNGSIPNDMAWFLNEDREGKIWVTSSLSDAYIIYPDGSTKVIKYKSGDPIYALSTFYEGGDSIFIGTGYGLSAFNIYNFNYGDPHLTNRKGDVTFKENHVCSIYKDSDNILWMGHQNGLTAWNLNTDSIYYISKDKGLDRCISLITEDDQRRIWIGTNSGLFCIVKSRSADNKMIFDVRAFYETDGLRNNYITRQAYTKMNNGDIIFGSVDGYTTISPQILYSPQANPTPIYFTGLKKNNEYVKVDSVYDGFCIDKSIRFLKSLRLKNDVSNLTIEFASSDIVNNHEKWYAYKIKNQHEKDPEWVVTRDNSITISHLKPGKYSLIVKPYNGSGDLSSEEGATLEIIVDRPLLLQWWAIVCYVIILLIIVVLWIKLQKKRHLKRLTNQAERYLEESKLRFFTNVSHDLRTQLTLVLSPLQLLEKEKLSGEIKNKVGDIRHNAEILLDQINSILDFRKLDVGSETQNVRTCEVAPFVKEIFSRFESYAQNRDMEYTLNMKDCDCYLTLDFDKVAKILTNIISNAFKYTPKGGKIEVSVSVCNDETLNKDMIISVADNGKGIRDEDKLRIFERFFQADHSNATSGSGIGLHIVKEYANIMNGSVSVEDNNPKGSVFTIRIPSKHSGNNENEEQVNDVEHQSTILFVDDNENLRQMVKEGLSPYYNVIVASDGKEALEKMQTNEVDIVVSDVMMPEMDGQELCKAIKSDINLSHIPVILLTARTADIHRKEGLELGADDYLTKPFNFDILRLRIDKFIELTRDNHKSFHNHIEINPSEITISSLDADLMDKALKIVEENISDSDFSVNTLSDKLAMSRSNLYKKIMALTGSGPSDFIRIIRLKRACQLLEKSDLRVSEIAFMVGFNSPKRFTANFKTEYGITPSEYQQNKGIKSLNPQN